MKTLKQFYHDTQKWVDGGCPNHPRFAVCVGLCDNLAHWGDAQLEQEQAQLFADAGLNEEYPFGSKAEYCFEYSKYDNPARLAWIRAHV